MSQLERALGVVDGQRGAPSSGLSPQRARAAIFLRQYRLASLYPEHGPGV
ncbi:hypothetical protein [Caballeronia pedi]|nr:hypothetical protein [Caballeronia pedi]